MPNSDHAPIRSRSQLIAALSEAAELEHAIMCSYLFAFFSLKQSSADKEGAARPARWRKALLNICVQEMGHLALVNNLLTAVGGGAHFWHSDFPIRAGRFPEAFRLGLRPFGREALEGFVFLERPEKQAKASDPLPAMSKGEALAGSLSPVPKPYRTVGELYSDIRLGFKALSATLGEQILFCGGAAVQLASADGAPTGVEAVRSLADAERAIDLIVEEGEGGAGDAEASHFQVFSKLLREFEEAAERNLTDAPAEDCAPNPVSRPALETGETFLVSAPAALEAMALFDRLYALMLRLLAQTYCHTGREPAKKRALLASAYLTMRVLSAVGSLLASLPAKEGGGPRAGASFSIGRFSAPYELGPEFLLLLEQVDEVLSFINECRALPEAVPQSRLAEIIVGLGRVRAGLAAFR